jgi:hypothetical protein
MPVRCICLACAVFLVLGVSSVLGQEDYTQWAYSKDIPINTGASGYDIGGDLSGFPYCVQVSGKNFEFNKAAGDGRDIRFANAQGVPLPYEIELWDSVAQKGLVWVRVDLIRGNNTTQSIKMYWGKSGVAGKSSGSAVFGTAGGFVAVWHLNSLLNATGNLNNLTRSSSGDPADGTGQTGNGMIFSGEGYLSAGSGPSISGPADFTASAWIKTEGSLEEMYVLSQRDITGYNGEYMFEINGDGACTFTLYNNGYQFTVASTGKVNDNRWHMITAVRKGDNGYIYIDGVQDGSGSGAVKDLVGTLATFVGIDGRDSRYGFSGKMDEVRISNVAHSADWLKLCYKNQKYVPAAAPSIRYPHDTFVITKDSLLSITPVISGDVDILSVSPAGMPMFLQFNKTTGEISGWLNDVSQPVTFYVRVSNDIGYTEDTITFTGQETPVLKSKAAVFPAALGIAAMHGASGRLRLSLSNELPGPFTVRVFSLQGRLVARQECPSANREIIIRTPGTRMAGYIVKLERAGRHVVGKLAVQR